VPLRSQLYPPEILAMMSRVLEECLATVVASQIVDEMELPGINTCFAQSILEAVANGYLHPEAIKQIVLENFRRSVA
jgi:hypothetical protein